MFKLLPKAIQKEVLQYLEKNEFTQAKEIYDRWFTQQADEVTSSLPRCSSDRKTLFSEI